MHPFVYLVDATFCKSPHHRMALDALQYLTCRHAKRWRRLFLKYYEDFLDGAKAPDTRFKDFRNHVLHVRQNNWGGALTTASEWYELTVEAVQQGAWRNVAYSAGVLSHYVTDPIHPFHTGQSKEESNIHRAFEWSTSKAYRRLRPLLEIEQDQISLELPQTQAWLSDALIAGATHANASYEELIKHYDFNVGYYRPVAGLDSYCEKKLRELIRYATKLFALVVSRAFDEGDVMPPQVHLHVETVFASAKAPVRWGLNRIEDIETRIELMRMHEEWERTGSVQTRLPEENRVIADQIANGAYEKARIEREKQEALEQRTARRRANQAERKPRRSDTATGVTTTANKLAENDRNQTVRRSRGDTPERSPATTQTDQRIVPMTEQTADNDLALNRQRRRPADDTRREERQEERLGQSNRVDSSRNAHETLNTNETRNTIESRNSKRPKRNRDQKTRQRETAETTTLSHPSTRRSSTGAGPSYSLALSDDVVDAPSIGPKTAKRLQRVGVRTVLQLLEANPDELSQAVDTNWITPHVVRAWQAQTTLVCRIAGVRGHDAQLLVACDYDTVEKVAFADTKKLLRLVGDFCRTPEGQRIVRSGKHPDMAEVQGWISNAQNARQLREAA